VLDKIKIYGRLKNVIEIGKVYCDMDQVLTNFLGGSRKALGQEFNDPCLGTDHEKWLILAKNPTFWLDLKWMPGAHQIWDRIKNKNTYILSACPPKDENPLCPSQKKEWCQRELGISSDRVFTVQRNDKKKFAMNGLPNLLIDDHYETVDVWHRAGGYGIWHQTVPETLIELQQFGL
jgi:hypothetical protein